MSERKSALPWEYYARSGNGLWMRAVRTEQEIRLEYQDRTQAVRGRVRTLDANGDVIADVHLAQMRWGAPWIGAGAVPLDDAFATWSTVRWFDSCAFGVMRHLVGLFAGGYGDTPEEIVSWFTDMAQLDWLVGGATYRIERDVAPINGLVGSTGELTWDDFPQGYFPVLQLKVNTREYPIILCDADWQRAFLCATVHAPTGMNA